jgi:hypothetical protein
MNKCKCSCCIKRAIREQIKNLPINRYLINIVDEYINHSSCYINELHEHTKFIFEELCDITCYSDKVINSSINEYTYRNEIRNFHNKTKIIKEDNKWIILYYM